MDILYQSEGDGALIKGMKLKVGLLTAALIFQGASLSVSAQEKAKPELSENETDRVIITMKKGFDSSALKEGEIQALDVPETKALVTMEVPEDKTLEEFIAEIEQEPGVAEVEPDYLIDTTYRPTDPYYSLQYHHTKLNMERAWERTKGSSDISVAVLDDGFDLDHPDLRGQWENAYSTASTMNEEDHGTHVAGIIGASMNNGIYGTGVAPGSDLIMIDVFEGDQAYTSDVIEGVYLAADLGADVINMSLGGYSYSTPFYSAVQYAHQRGAVIVAASGNDDSYQPMYPASYENVISVGATDQNDRITNFSNYGPYQDLVAPGAGIWSTISRGSFSAFNGTSMASPVVAAVAALVKANEPELVNFEIEERLFETSVDLGSPGKDIFYGYGRVDAAAALMIFDIQQPEVAPVYDHSTEVTGNVTQSLADATITLSNGPDELASLEGYEGNGSFTLTIPKQKANTVLQLTVTDRYGNESAPLDIRVIDTVAPEMPVVEQVTDRSTAVTGKAEAASRISVKAGAKEIGSGTVGTDGKFSAAIEKQKAGTKLSVTATDAAGNASEAASITVKDVTAPAAPTVDQVTEKSTRLSGTAEANSTVVVQAGSEELAKGTAASDGKFSFAIEPQKAGTVLTVTATDAAGNKSAETKVTVSKAAPEAADRISGTDRYKTAIAISQNGWTKADTVVLATGGDFPDALAGGPLAYQEDAPVLLTRSKTLTPETKAEIVRLGAKKVIVLGSKGAISLEVEAELKQMGLAIERLGGKNRYETAALIAAKVTSDQAVIANGQNFPDVLSISSYAAKNGVPILLTRTDRLPDEMKALTGKMSSTYVIGSTGAVSQAVFSELPKPTRFGGKDRYETGYEVATKLKLGTDKAYIATGSNFPDALAGSVLAAKNNAPILLVRPQAIPEATHKQLTSYNGFSIFGGTGAVSDNVKSLLDETLKNN